MCQKIKYATKADAAADAIIIRNNLKRFSKKFTLEKKCNKKMVPYACSKCGCWHLTTRTKRKYL